MARPFVSLYALFFALGAVCAPHATLSQAEDDQHEHELKSGLKVSYGTIGSQFEAFTKSSKSLVEISRVSKKEVAHVYVSARHKAVPIVIPLVCVFFVLLALLILKMTYLKQRRLQTIHELPILLTTLREEDEQESTYGHLSTRVADTLNTTDMRSMYSNASRPVSKRSSTASSNNGTSRNVRQRIDSTTGLLVGLLGSPDWETHMQRELADHQWRLRRESRKASDISQHRHTWHSQQSYSYSRHSTTRSHPESSIRDQSSERRARRYSGRHSSLRIPHVSSFGEVGLDTFRDRKQRPKSLNAVVDRMSASQSGSTPNRSPATSNIWQSDSYVNSTGGCSGFSASVNTRSQRPSTISEVDTPRSTLSRGHDASFHFRVTDYGGGTPIVNESVASPVLRRSAAQTGSVDSGLGTASMEMSSTLERLNASADSIGGSWRQLPQFPSPPATPISPASPTPQTPNSIEVNTICVEPYYFNEQFYNGMVGAKASSSELICASGYGLRFLGEDKSPERCNQLFEIAPSTMDFGWPTLSDTLVSDLLHLVLPSPLDEGQYSAAISSTSELTDASAQTCQVQEALAKRRNDGHSGFLSPFAANIQNRHHSRVREHVPFSLVAPPPAYLKSPRLFERTVQFSLEAHEMIKEDGAGSKSTLHATSLVDLSAPVRPSPLRRVASMDSIVSSRASTGGVENINAVNISNESETSTECVVEHGRAESGVSVKPSEQKPNVKISQSTVEAQATDAHELKPKASHASLFLDLGGSSISFGDEPSEFYSFDTAENAGMEQSMGYSESQASSSGVLYGSAEECSHEDIEYIVELHSGSFTGV